MTENCHPIRGQKNVAPFIFLYSFVCSGCTWFMFADEQKHARWFERYLWISKSMLWALIKHDVHLSMLQCVAGYKDLKRRHSIRKWTPTRTRSLFVESGKKGASAFGRRIRRWDREIIKTHFLSALLATFQLHCLLLFSARLFFIISILFPPSQNIRTKYNP